ncbi:hypothetical protein ACFQ58_03885 [Agromyces sp. NPDC056523]|uniref:hypothetical protein n=1 Tax=Agromyces sp. NPDC056523 TaxID=3345850 RepID=UPI003672939D
MSGSYGIPGTSQPDPKQPVTSMDTAAATAAEHAHGETADARSMAASRVRRNADRAVAPSEGTGS